MSEEVKKNTQIEASVWPKDTLFFRQACGSAKLPDGGKVELTTHVGQGFPIIGLPDGRSVTFN